MKSRIIRVMLVLALLLGGCQTTRKVTTTFTKDSTTTITARPVQLQIKADTATQSFGVTKFLQDLHDAPQGHVIAEKQGRGKLVGFRIIKTLALDSASGLGFKVQATSAGKDTTIYVHDTVTVVRYTRLDTVTHVKKPGLWQGFKEEVGYVGFGLILALLLLLARQVEKRIN